MSTQDSPVDQAQSIDTVLNEPLSKLSISDKRHPWEGEEPKQKSCAEHDLKVDKCKYSDSGDSKVDLQEIVNNLPKFFCENVFPYRSTPYKELDAHLSNRQIVQRPYSDEIKGKRKVHRSSEGPNRAMKFKEAATQTPADDSFIKFIDCDYMLRIYIPPHLSERYQRLIDPSKYSDPITERWVFTPSYLRPESGLFDWDDVESDSSKTCRVIVVRPFEFQKYIAWCGHRIAVLCLPEDMIGIGYSRHWIVKVATRVGLSYVWMIDDSVAWFYEYNPVFRISEDTKEKVKRRLKFDDAFKMMEDLLKFCKDNDKIVAISPSRWNGKNKAQQPFTYKPPHTPVLINLKLLNHYCVQYRPELQSLEDMIFGAECAKNGLTVCRWNRILMYDVRFEDTGCDAPYSRDMTPAGRKKTQTSTPVSNPTTPGQSSTVQPHKLEFSDSN